MAVTKAAIRSWLAVGKKKEATHMLVICDSYDYEDYPVYVMPGEDAYKIRQETCKPNNMQRCMECYSYAFDLEEQLKEYRANNFD